MQDVNKERVTAILEEIMEETQKTHKILVFHSFKDAQEAIKEDEKVIAFVINEYDLEQKGFDFLFLLTEETYSFFEQMKEKLEIVRQGMTIKELLVASKIFGEDEKFDGISFFRFKMEIFRTPQ